MLHFKWFVLLGQGRGGEQGFRFWTLDVAALLGALLLAKHAALPVTEEAQVAGRRGGRGGVQAHGEEGQCGPLLHLVISSVVTVGSAWDSGAVGNGAR
jgi:hypothetical protein